MTSDIKTMSINNTTATTKIRTADDKVAMNIDADSAVPCSNCGTKLSGQFCHNCGQSSKSMIKFFGEVIRELFDDALGYDSRFKHSILPLLFKPGKLSLDYVNGKRFFYVLPFRLYLITSLIFLVVIKNTAEIHEGSNIENAETIAAIDGELAREISDDDDFSISITIDGSDSDSEAGEGEGEGQNIITSDLADDAGIFKQEKIKGFHYSWDSETERWTDIDLLEDGIEKDFLQTIGPKIAGWKKDPTPLINKFIDMLPYMMFVVLPIFGMILKGFYIFSGRYYTEHLIFLLHNHSFLYIAFLLQISVGAIDDFLTPSTYWLTNMSLLVLSAINFILYLWIIIYMLLAVKRFYQQGWVMTLVKTTLLSSIYFILLFIGFIVTLFVGAYQA